MSQSLLQLFLWIQNTQVGTAIRESNYLFVIILGFHALGLAVSVGVVFWFDLRLLGFSMKEQAVSAVYKGLLPIMAGGFTIMFASGFLLFWAQAGRCYQNAYCHTKIPLLLVPGANALLYHLFTERNIAEWDTNAVPPPRARVAGLVSILSWTAIIILGRQISF
jgi:hypothetical protein